MLQQHFWELPDTPQKVASARQKTRLRVNLAPEFRRVTRPQSRLKHSHISFTSVRIPSKAGWQFPEVPCDLPPVCDKRLSRDLKTTSRGIIHMFIEFNLLQEHWISPDGSL